MTHSLAHTHSLERICVVCGSLVLPQTLGEPTTLSWITNDFGSTLGFGSSILLAFLIGFHARVRTQHS